ncbi:GNAT family N-acetyltransferase [Kitasatospora brasiliensis]|uniref:GNAT family N-acetyltransferase n=1 Tax=Kitasatospora brasiliensis TaxID=3058040 RepID=UPI002931B028|nr:GNAT family N-acetyltransferase [Kitasatospora sp. K002]
MKASRTRPARLRHRPVHWSARGCAVPGGQAARPHRPADPVADRADDLGSDGSSRLSLPDGRELLLRPAGPGDRAAALAMHRRCSPATLRLRYHGPVRDADRYLDHLLDPRHGHSLAVSAPDGRIVALGHLMWDDGEAELAVLVEDAWQRHGLGPALLRRLSAAALAAGVRTVYAVTHGGNTGLIAAMRRLDAPLDFHAEDGTVVITATLAAGDPARCGHRPGR